MRWRCGWVWLLGGWVALGGCANTRLITFHDLDRARKVELQVRRGETIQEVTTQVVLDEPGRIERIAAIVSARKEEWEPAKKPPLPPGYLIVFKHVDGSTESFGFDDSYLSTNIHAPSANDVKYRRLTPEETTTILETFRFTTNTGAAKPERTARGPG